MKLNKQAVEYINSLVEAKAKPKLDALKAQHDAAQAKQKRLRDAAKAEVDKALAEAGKKILAIYRKHGVTPHRYGEEVKEIEFSDNIHFTKTKFDKEVEDASDKVTKFQCAVAQKQTEVVARLSLGGTAEDLDAIIDAIEF